MRFIFLVLCTFFGAFFLLTSCKKEVESRLPGKWDYLGDEYFISNSVFVSDTALTEVRATVVFNEGGTGSFTLDGEKSVMNWKASDSEVTLSIEGKDTITYSVKTNEKDVQIWEYTTEDCKTENAMSYCYKWDYQLQLKRLE